jgi:hypothetical protein
MTFGKISKGATMAAKRKKVEYSELDQALDIEAFRDSFLDFFSKIPDPPDFRIFDPKLNRRSL